MVGSMNRGLRMRETDELWASGYGPLTVRLRARSMRTTLRPLICCLNLDVPADSEREAHAKLGRPSAEQAQFPAF